jgi:hypothetical protein
MTDDQFRLLSFVERKGEYTMNQDTLNTPSPVPAQPRLRRTLVIGLGGTGHRVVVQAKAQALQSWGAERVERVIKFLVFDTAHESLTATCNGQPVAMELSSEFVDIGQTPVGKIKRNLDRQAAIQERLGGVMASLPPAVLRNGAKQLRPLGLVAFLWRYAEVEERLRKAIWELAGRRQSEGRQGINVFIANSLVGGTGSSTFLDVAHLVRDIFDELGTLADFCYITGVGVLPRAFHGIHGPNLVPNAVASLKELNHCMMRGGFSARYPTGRRVTTAQPPFNIYYLVDGVDEEGHTWRGLDEVCRLAAEAIFLQMGSQVGQKQENAFDNLDDVLVQQTEEGDGTFCGSFGLASLVFSGPALARTCSARQAVQVIQHGLLAPVSWAAADPPQEAGATLENLVHAAGLDPTFLAERLARDDQGTPLAVDLAVPGWAERLSPQSAPGELARYVRDYERARLGADFKRWLDHNQAQLGGNASQVLSRHLIHLARQAGLPAAEASLAALLEWIDERASRLSARQTEDESRLAGLSRELAHLETAFLQSAEGSFLGRGRRVARAQSAYFGAAQRLYSLRWRAQVTAGVLAVLNHAGRVAREGLDACRAATARLKAARRSLEETAADLSASSPLADGITTRSLSDQALADRLFERHAPPVADTLATLFSGDSSPLDWHDLSPAQIQAILLDACQPAFQLIAALSVEDAIKMQTDQDDTTPEGYYHWLMQQATPSWNLDRTRLSDGGASLQRIEVLGVPDEADSLYRRHATSLVSTGDRSRLVAFVARMGAAHTAIQHWDNYQATYERARGHVPLHVLPHFQADNERDRQTFALASLFGFIKSQGSYFYYVPADNLEPPVKLAQGLANALQSFSKQDGMVREAWERVEQVVASRGVEATLRALAAYYNSGNERDRLSDLVARPGDDLLLELKRLVRAYADELRQIHQFAPGPWHAEDETEDGDD